MPLEINLQQAIFALTEALDLVGVDEFNHGKRVGYMAFKCAGQMGLSKGEREYLFHMGMLHDCGVSSTQVHHRLVTELEWEHADEHAELGARLLSGFPYFEQYVIPVRYHHTRWETLTLLDSLDPKDARNANLIFLVDRVDALAASHYEKGLLEHTHEIITTVQAESGRLFSPELVDIFVTLSRSDAFWMMLEPPHLDRFLYDMERHITAQLISIRELKDLAGIFAHIVDAKSKFTYEHSHCVAKLARYLAECDGFDQETCDGIEIAGLLHDLGKLRIPDEILDKPGALDVHDRIVMRQHSFETYQILRGIEGMEEIALWAAYHHEAPSGTGYPFGRSGEELSREARIIAVADVFQALVQDRPYRASLTLEKIATVLRNMADNNRLDGGLVEFVLSHSTDCLQIAKGQAPDYIEVC